MQTDKPTELSRRTWYFFLCLLIAQIVLATLMSITLPFWLGYSNPYHTGGAPLTVIGVVMTVLALSTMVVAFETKMPKVYERFVNSVSLLVLAIALVAFLLWLTQGIGTASNL